MEGDNYERRLISLEYQLIEPRIPHEQLTAVERVLTNRGIELENIEHYLNTTNNDILNPSLLDNIMEGAKMLARHVANEDNILLWIDSDADGYTSAASLLNYLYCLFPAYTQDKIVYKFHPGKEHGIIAEEIPNNIKLVIAPDSSSNDYDEHKKLKERGIDVLVIDHHEAEKVSEFACVINNQLCGYPTKSLSGVGMVYKFCQFFDNIMDTDYANYNLDLVALGMIADMMDMRDFETKHLINIGLEDIHNPFFKAMVEKNAYSLKGEITPTGVAFYVAPYVNATVRMGTAEEKRILFDSMLDFKAYDMVDSTKRGCKGQKERLVDQAVRNCVNIKSRQTKARDNTLETIERLIKTNGLNKNKILIVCIPKEVYVEKNLTGLIANQLMAKYQKPVLLLNEIQHEENVVLTDGHKMKFTWSTWEGSARGYDKSALTDFRKFCQDSGVIDYAEGHANAFGFGIADKKLDDFINYCETTLKDFEFTPCYSVDFIFSADNFNPTDILEIAELRSLWGQGVSEPYIAMTNVKVSSNSLQIMSPDKNPTLKIMLPDGTSIIKFGVTKKVIEQLTTEGYLILDVVGRCEANTWGGRTSAQIIMEDFDIVNAVQYYF